MIRALILFLTVILIPAELWAEEQSIFEEANQLFEKANAQALVNPTEAQELYQKSILKYQYLIDEKGVHTAELHANLGNAYFSGGDMGRAVLHYQRALDIDPMHSDLVHNLHYARSLTIDEAAPTRMQKIRKGLTFWHRWSFAIRAICFGAAHAALWGLVALLFYRRGRWIYGSIAGVAILSLMFGISMIASHQRWDNSVDGVVIERAVIARQGNGFIYDNAFTSSLHAGTEFGIIEKRADWYHAKLINGDTCWLPVNSVELVRGE